MCQIKYTELMRNCKDKKQHRLVIVNYALAHGIKAAAKAFGATRNTIRKWTRRYQKGQYQALADLSRRPLHSPNATPEHVKEHIAALKDTYKRIGAEQIKILEELPQSERTIRKIWREKGKSSRQRRKKHVTKRNLREVKKQLNFLEMVCEDTKVLDDIPEYLPAIRKNNAPSIQYTFRDMTTGLLFMGFGNEKSLTYSVLFAHYIHLHFKRYGVDLSETTRQTDNGSEYIGSWNAKESSGYTKVIESIKGQRHVTIPVRAHRYQADVETVHDIIEREFFEVEIIKDRVDFFNKMYTYQLFFDLQRPNTYKENKCPWHLAREKMPSLKKEVAMLPPVDLDLLFASPLGQALLSPGLQGGHYVPSSP